MAHARTRPNLDVATTGHPTSARRTKGGHLAAAAPAGWRVSARRLVRDNPVAVLIGAFVIGVALARVARHA
jgi:hypothetical protein